MKKQLKIMKSDITNKAIAFLLALFFLIFPIVTYSQVDSTEIGDIKGERIPTKVIDKIVGIIGDGIVLKSDIEGQLMQMKLDGYPVTDESKCELLEDMIIQKIMVAQAKIDSVEVNESQVDQELERRFRFFVSQIGSEKKLEEFYGKTIKELKEDFRKNVEEQLLVQNMQQIITSDAKVTPSDVSKFYRGIHPDSLPFINSEYTIAHITKVPKVSKESRLEAREKIEKIRERVLKGEKFSTMALLYSEDPGSARKGGELGFVPRGTFVSEFEELAFSIQPGEVSEVIQTQFGFHFMEVIERRGDDINVRHVLIIPKLTEDDLLESKAVLDSVYSALNSEDSISFEKVAKLFSDDENTSSNGGVLVNYQTGATKFEADQLDKNTFFVIDKLKEGEFSQPVPWKTEDGQDAYRIIKLVKRTEPHKANLVDDYGRIQDAALAKKKETIMMNWIQEHALKTYINLDDEFINCKFEAFDLNIAEK